MESDTSPKSKKMKLSEPENCLKRGNDAGPSSKRVKVEKGEVDLQAMKRKNFVTACEQVSREAYFDYATRLQLVYVPACMKGSICKHNDSGRSSQLREMPDYAEEAVKIETKANMWYEALEVCQMCITEKQYLSANVLKEVVEIMMNAHNNDLEEFTIEELIDKCQQLLSQNFSTHSPCITKTLRNCYKDFLTSPMDLKEKTFTNRTEFGYDKGVVKYCMNRLEYEISSESKDGALLDKYENIPEEMKQGVRGLYWQNEKFEIFELLERPDRIERLMAVLESLVELLQYDLAIWHYRHPSNLGNHIMRSNKPLMAYVLWSNNVLYTGAVNANCRQILRLFVHLIHLRYPEEYIDTMTTWLNVVVQTFYSCESQSNSDYPNTGKYCAVFAREFYKIISDMPYETIIKVLERIQPPFMQHMIGTLHIQTILSTQEDNIIKIFIDFIKKSKLETFHEGDSEIYISKSQVIKPREIKNVLKYFTKICERAENYTSDFSDYSYPKLQTHCGINDTGIDQNYIVHVFYITIESYLESFSVQLVQDTLEKLNEQLPSNSREEIENTPPELSTYLVTESFIKKYRSIYQTLTELILLLNSLKCSDKLPKIMNVFENIGLLE